MKNWTFNARTYLSALPGGLKLLVILQCAIPILLLIAYLTYVDVAGAGTAGIEHIITRVDEAYKTKDYAKLIDVLGQSLADKAHALHYLNAILYLDIASAVIGAFVLCLIFYGKPNGNHKSNGAAAGINVKGSSVFPMQPIVVDKHGVVRFKKNLLVETAFKDRLNEMARQFPSDQYPEEWMQLAQLIGYSVGGYCDLDYVSSASSNQADDAADTKLDADRWRFMAPQIAKIVGVDFGQMVADVDKAMLDGFDIETYKTKFSNGWRIESEVIVNAERTQHVICQMEFSDEIVVDHELTAHVLNLLNDGAAKSAERLLEERDALGKGIRDAAVKRGICREDVDLTGPQLLLLCDDLARA